MVGIYRSMLTCTVCFVAILALEACSTTPQRTKAEEGLDGYIKSYGYVPFNPPRARDGVGTIIDFKDGTESVVASPEPPLNQCLTPNLVPRGDDIQVAALRQEYTQDNKAGLDLSLAKGLVKNLNLTAAFSDNRVRKVSIQLDGAFESRITRQSVLGYVSTLDPKDPCYRNFVDPQNYIIWRVLGAARVTYTFTDNAGVNISLDASLMDKIGIKPELKSQFEGKSALAFDSRLLIGYRTWKATEAAGAVGAPIILTEVSVEDAIRARSFTARK